jgi:two-component system NarL family sensor kinase
VPSLRTNRWTLLRALGASAAAAVALGWAAGGWPGAGSLFEPVVTAAVSFTSMGALILVGVPGHPVGRLFTVAGVAAGLETVALAWLGWTPTAWLAQWLWWPPFGLAFLALLVFPDGQLDTRPRRALAGLLVVASTVATVALAVAALDHPRTLLVDSTSEVTPRARVLLQVALGAVFLTLLGLAGVLVVLGARWRRATGLQRQQLACLVPGGAILLIGILLDAENVPGLGLLSVVAVPAALTLAVLRHRLYGLDVVINRATVWGVLSLGVVAVYLGAVALLQSLLGGAASLVATGLIALGFEPVRRWLQRRVNRLLYGGREDPYRVISELGTLLGDRTDGLPELVATVAESLKVPYVAVELDQPAGAVVVTRYGQPATPVEEFPMVSRGLPVGRVLVGRRSPGARFAAREERLLRDVAQQVAMGAQVGLLERALAQAGEQVDLAREDERRKLRRDLHDGVMSSLAGMSMRTVAARRHLEAGSRAGPILDGLGNDLRGTRGELRRLVERLRPAVLDDGLEVALKRECARYQDAGLAVRLTIDGHLGDLPAAVAVAAHRIVAESLTNVARHAAATECDVTVRRDPGRLAIDVVDDGVGLPETPVPGAGLPSLRERAAELGGCCEVRPREVCGTVVRLRIPVRPAP